MTSWLKQNWFYIAAGLITVFGLITGKFLFLFIALPFGMFKFSAKNKNDSDKT